MFSINTDGSGYSILRSFTGGGSDGSDPQADLTYVGSILYGTTGGGGSADYGTVFSINTDGSGFMVLHSFPSESGDGREPNADLTLVGSALYGTTSIGGAADDGTVFSLNTDGSGYTVQHSFASEPGDGDQPLAGLAQVGSILYGTTKFGGSVDGGTVFSINVDGSGFNVLHAFASRAG